MLENDSGYTFDDLVRHTGLPERTIRYYFANKLVPPPTSRGPRATYTEEHLLKLKLIEQLKRRMKLEDIRERLAGLSPGELQTMLATETEREAPIESARDFISTLLAHEPPPSPAQAPARPEAWLRIPLADGVELHLTPAAHERLRDELPRISDLVNRRRR